MSWSLCVTEKSREDALRVFSNTVAENASSIPMDTRLLLCDLARDLAGLAPETGHHVTIATDGHVKPSVGPEPNGAGDVRLALRFSPSKLVVPNVHEPA